MQNDFVIKKMISTIQVEFFGGFLARCNRTWGMESEKTYYNQFYFVLKGECKIKIGDDEYIVRENQMILLPKDIPIVSSLTESCELIKYWCGFTASVSDINFFDMVETKYLIDVDDIGYVESLFEGMLHKRNFTNSEADILEQKAFLLRLIAYYLERSFVKRVYATSTGVDFEPVLRYMQENMSQKISIPYLAEMMHLNQDYFTRVFKKLFACTPTKFLEQMRLSEAARLIMTTSKPISEIARMVGIEDVYYFSRFFKQRQQQSMSPSQFRRIRKGSINE